MKKKFSLLTVLIVVFTACEKMPVEPFFPNEEDSKETEYPINIPFTEYSLAGTSCQWTNYQGNYDSKEVVIINSNEKLRNYVKCTSESDYPEIDFSKYTLLLAHGIESHLVIPNYTSLQQLFARSYTMKVNLSPNIASVITYWQVPIIVSKIADDSVIELIVTKNH